MAEVFEKISHLRHQDNGNKNDFIKLYRFGLHKGWMLFISGMVWWIEVEKRGEVGELLSFYLKYK